MPARRAERRFVRSYIGAMTRPPLLALAGLAAGPVLAQVVPVGHAGEVVVTARRPIVVVAGVCPDPDPARYPDKGAPRVVDSYPAPGATLAPGPLQVRVSFDQPMSCYSEVMVDGGEGDPCRPDGTWMLPGRRSWLMSCRFPPSTPVRIGFRRIDGRGFVALSGRPALPYVLDFTTSAAPPATSLEAAAAADPGAPGEAPRTTANVTGTDRGHPPATGRDCRREVVGAPPL